MSELDAGVVGGDGPVDLALVGVGGGLPGGELVASAGSNAWYCEAMSWAGPGAPLADLTNSGIGGFNGVVAPTTGRRTFAYSAYLNRLIFNDPTFADTGVITHQVTQ